MSLSQRYLPLCFARVLATGPFDPSDPFSIDLNELKTAIERVSARADDATLKQMIAFGDDDVSMTVSFDEFKRIMSGDKRVALV